MTQRPYLLRFETAPVRDKRGDIVLYDMYVYGEWIGSRRTLEQCDLAFTAYR